MSTRQSNSNPIPANIVQYLLVKEPIKVSFSLKNRGLFIQPFITSTTATASRFWGFLGMGRVVSLLRMGWRVIYIHVVGWNVVGEHTTTSAAASSSEAVSASLLVWRMFLLRPVFRWRRRVSLTATVWRRCCKPDVLSLCRYWLCFYVFWFWCC